MAETTPDDSSGAPVERLARSLMACAGVQPSLLARSRTAADGALPGPIEELPQLFAQSVGLLSNPVRRPSERSPYLEELVSIAVSTARQAEDAARHASDACALARRERFGWIGFGVLGIVIGIAGVVDAHWIPGMNHGQAEMVSETRLPDEPKGSAADLPGPAVAAPSPAIPARQVAGPSQVNVTAETVAPPPLPAAIPIAVRPTWSIASAEAQPRYDSAPFYTPPPRPKYRTHRTHHVNAAPRPPVVLARFLANLRRDVHAIFR